MATKILNKQIDNYENGTSEIVELTIEELDQIKLSAAELNDQIAAQAAKAAARASALAKLAELGLTEEEIAAL